jgi:predicted MPP superfamily phosphohydrolase
MTNRKFLFSKKTQFALGAVAGLSLIGIGTYFWASRIESKRYKFEKVKILSGNKCGDKSIVLKILHLSDLHLSYDEADKIKFLRTITKDEYDMVVLTGDIFENYTGLQHASSLLANKPRLGAYAVLGNHDYYDYNMFHKTFGRIVKKFRHPRLKRDVRPIVDALESNGITVMRNCAQTLTNAPVHVIGIDYPGIDEKLLQELVANAPNNHLILALFHIPHGLDMLANNGIDVAFGGHTHGGQIRIPGIGAIITDSELSRKEASGLIYRGNTAIHISRGLGADPKTNFRLFCPPHATLIELEHRFFTNN